jgi:hypothetical protein
MSWSVDNFRAWATTILGLWLIIADAALLVGNVWTNESHDWNVYTASGAILMLMVGLWLLGIKDFNPWKYLPWIKR